ncbi:MAG: ABC transporter substrate-binding protein [Pseudomonadota bacterium]|nr:ABC transporter substrate-binding protein [Pseudomonadota bacterium]
MKSIILLLATTLMIVGCDRQPDTPPSGKVVRIGVIGPFSGSDQTLGNEAIKGIRTAMQVLPLLDNGDLMELVIEDDRNDPASTAAALEKLSGEEQVAAVVLMSTSSPALKIASVADTYETPVLALFATHPGVTNENRYVSQLCFDNEFQGAVAALFVRDELLIDRAAVFVDPASATSRSLAKRFATKFASVGGEIVEMVSISRDPRDYDAVLERLSKMGVELLYVPIDAVDVVHIAESADRLGWRPEMIGSDGLVARATTQFEDTSVLDGTYSTDFFSSDLSWTDFGEMMEASFRSLYDTRGNTYVALGAEGYGLIRHAMNRCEDPNDRACVNGMLRSTRNFEGFAGYISITPDGKPQRPVFVNAIDDGRMRFVTKVY